MSLDSQVEQGDRSFVGKIDAAVTRAYGEVFQVSEKNRLLKGNVSRYFRVLSSAAFGYNAVVEQSYFSAFMTAFEAYKAASNYSIKDDDLTKLLRLGFLGVGITGTAVGAAKLIHGLIIANPEQISLARDLLSFSLGLIFSASGGYSNKRKK